MRNLTQNIFDRLRAGRVARAGALIVSGAVVATAQAAESVTIPPTGVDVPGYITAAITALGLVVAAVIGGYFAFLIIKKGMRWAGRALG